MTIDHAPGESIADALQQVLPSTRGNVLCFLPGTRDIAAAIASCTPIARAHDVELVPLHGSLDASEQDRALSPDPARRRVIIATNVAETSLTVPGVSAVIDSGLQKVARYDADRAIDSLTTERITLDSADQRAGRSARLGPGLVRRLWDARDRLRPHREAEIHRVDLSSVLLSILAWGSSPGSFEWFDRPMRAHRDREHAARAAGCGRGRADYRARTADAAAAAAAAARSRVDRSEGFVRGSGGVRVALGTGPFRWPSGRDIVRSAANHRSMGTDAAAPAAGRAESPTISAAAPWQWLQRSDRRHGAATGAAGGLSRSSGAPPAAEAE